MNPIVSMFAPLIQKIVLEVVARATPIIAEKLTALLPVIVAAAVKELTARLTPQLGPINLPDMPDLAESVRKVANEIPDIDIPVLSDIFDLTEWLKGK